MATAIDLDDIDGLEPHNLDRPVLVWDGDCGFCKKSVLHLVSQLGDRVRYVTYQSAHQCFPGLSRRALAEAVHFIEPDGRVSRGAEAVFRAYSWRPQGSLLLGLYKRSPLFAALAEWGYRRVAHNRRLAGRVAKLIPGW